MPWTIEREIVALIHRCARLSDQGCYLEWMELFTPDGVYAAITLENLEHKGLYLFRDIGTHGLQERVAFLRGLLQVSRGKTLHLITNIEVQGETEDAVSSVSNFLMTRTADMEHPVLHACGSYRDRFVRQNGAWLFQERLVILDSNLLPPESTELF